MNMQPLSELRPDTTGIWDALDSLFPPHPWLNAETAEQIRAWREEDERNGFPWEDSND